jgi:hypothetical protein
LNSAGSPLLALRFVTPKEDSVQTNLRTLGGGAA